MSIVEGDGGGAADPEVELEDLDDKVAHLEGGDPNEGELNEPEPPAYEPNLTYSFMDQEFTFDDRVKDLVKSKEDEDYFRDLYTAQKAHAKYKEMGGIREVESKLGEYDSLTGFKTQYEELDRDVKQLGQMLQNGNIEQFRQTLGIPKEQLLEWAINEAKAQQDPAYSQQLNQQYQQQQQTFDLQYQNQMLQNNIQQQEVQQYHAQLDSALESSEVAKAFDSAVGTPGSFKQAVINHGIAQFQNMGRNISVQEAVAQVTQQYQGLVATKPVGTEQVQPTPTQQQTPNNPDNTVVIQQQGKKTIPNVQGGNQSPAKKAIKSLDDIRKIHRSL